MFEASQRIYLLDIPKLKTLHRTPTHTPTLNSTHLTPCTTRQQGCRHKYKPHILSQYILGRMTRIRTQKLVEGKRRNRHPDSRHRHRHREKTCQLIIYAASQQLITLNTLDFLLQCVLSILVVDVGCRQVFFSPAVYRMHHAEAYPTQQLVMCKKLLTAYWRQLQVNRQQL